MALILRTYMRFMLLMICALVMSALVSPQALAQLSFTVGGAVVQSACTPNIPSGSHSRQLIGGNTVTMPTVDLSDLNVAGKTAGGMTIQFRATGCTGSSINNMWVHFTSANVDGNGRIIPTGNSKVRFEIRNDNNSGTLVKVGGSAGDQPNSDQGTAASFSGSHTSSRSANKYYGVRYFAHEAVETPGGVSASVTANFKYY